MCSTLESILGYAGSSQLNFIQLEYNNITLLFVYTNDYQLYNCFWVTLISRSQFRGTADSSQID